MCKLSYHAFLFASMLVLQVRCSGGGDKSISDASAPIEAFKVQISAAESPKDYIDQLGCLNCHGGATSANQVITKAPDLSRAGYRYKPEYIFNYLQNPTRVRNHIGLSRMPNFAFDEREALALTLYLSSKKDILNVKFPDFSESGNVNLGEREFNEQACASCHRAEGQGNNVISDLSNMGSKLNPVWMRQFIAAPAAFQNGNNMMPGLLYHFNTDSTSLIQNVEDADEKIENLSAYLLSLEAPDHDEQLDRYTETQKSNSEISVEIGRKIYQAQNCSGCHQSDPDGQWKETVAPDLLTVQSRINESWLADYIKQPHAIRPFGFHPGSGSRMPDFSLTEAEVQNIVRFLYDKEIKEKTSVEEPSQFVKHKIETLLDEKFPCIGCHSIGGKGGRIAPDLAGLSKRLNSDYLTSMVTNPSTAMPGTIMPKISMPQNLRDQLIAYLVHNNDTVTERKYLSLIDHPITLPSEELTPENIYLSKCAICHGEKGNANGFNAAYMATQPTKHADGSYMAKKPDDTLFDGVYAGGYILNKSHLMPAWGNALSKNEIQGLVSYMRSLCNCSPPKWSTDDRTTN
ncbi:MAG: c-type cytochrome [Cyclobacteriaceae bacterium]|nr:c-type cytochrome [Cyclobacteriaceae bacterium]